MCTNLVLYLKNDIFAKLNRMKMVVVSSREFRANQRKYFDLALTNDVVITSRSHGSYRLVQWEKVIRSLIRPLWRLKSDAELRSMNRVRFIEWRKGRVLMASLVEWLMKTEMYRIVFSNDAKKDLKELSKKAPQAVKNQASHHCCDVGPFLFT